jgi:quercetin 2,3-dioxygenase
VYAGLFDGNEEERLLLPDGRFAYVHVARGSVAVNGQRLAAGDGARLRDEREIELHDGSGAEVLVFDLRPNELPGH